MLRLSMLLFAITLWPTALISGLPTQIHGNYVSDFQKPLRSSLFADVKVVIAKESADDACLKKIEKRLHELEATLGLTLDGKTVNLRYATDDPPELGDSDYARTDPVLGDDKSVTLIVKKNICTIGAKLLDIVIAHELFHVERFTGKDGKEYREAQKEYQDANDAYEKAAAAASEDPKDKDKNKAYAEALKKMRAAKAKALKRLKKEEDDAFDFVKKNKDKLGLSEKDLEENEKLRKEEQKDLDKQIAKQERR